MDYAYHSFLALAKAFSWAYPTRRVTQKAKLGQMFLSINTVEINKCLSEIETYVSLV